MSIFRSRNNETPSRNKSPPLKKTRRKEQGTLGSTPMNNNNNNNNANNFQQQQQQQQQQQPMRVLGSATAGSSSESGKSEHQPRSDRFSLGKITSNLIFFNT
jgi:hypothetical protein